MAAIGRFGTRVVPELSRIVQDCRARKQIVEGSHIERFEQEFARVLGAGHVRACSTEYGRMALYFILKAIDLPPGSEIIVPAFTFWVVPEMTRVAGLTPVFADIDPETFTLSPGAVERAITPRTRAVLPTHLYGMSCDMDPILDIARRHHLKVIEDCAHSLGATYKGRMVGTLGDASFFSFQAFKPLNTFGGGLAWLRDADVARRVGEYADAEAWPTEQRVERILRSGKWQQTFIRPKVFTCSLFPIWWAASWIDAKPEKRLWEHVRPLDPLPTHYRGRFTNVQAAIGLAGLEHLPEFIERTRHHAALLDDASATLAASPFHMSQPIARTSTTNTAPTSPTATPSSNAAFAVVSTSPRCTSMSVPRWCSSTGQGRRPPARSTPRPPRKCRCTNLCWMAKSSASLVRDQVLRLHASAPRILRTHVR
jgi:dTDP-4-amino-4,6-dideoxygalactose transaminase